MKLTSLRHKFVKFIPDRLDEGVLYISVAYATATHRCACGCGEIVVTPIKPTDWSLTWNGESVSLYPSIGNWSLPCRSHYWIRESRIIWAGTWSREKIAAGRKADSRAKARFYPNSLGQGTEPGGSVDTDRRAQPNAPDSSATPIRLGGEV
jgi:hypothetical protein